jgi:hypothetical protein
MKWILLALCFACGKYEEPGPVDYADSDGDQVLNYQEVAYEKYFANIDVLGQIEAKLKFVTIEPIEIMMANNHFGSPMDVIVSSEKKLISHEFFSEWADLRVSTERRELDLKKNKYNIQLEFTQISDTLQEVYLREGKEIVSLGNWKQVMKFDLTSGQLKNILAGKSFISLKKEFRRGIFFENRSDETIRQKTYKLHFFDGKVGKILYVSKDLSFSELQKILKIKALDLKSEDDLFYYSHRPGHTGWYAREFNNGEKALVYAEDTEIRKNFMSQYLYNKAILSRVNGSPDKIIKLSNKKTANVFLRIRPVTVTERFFSESNYKKIHGYGGGGINGNGPDPWECYHFIRSIITEKTGIPDYSTLLKNLNIEVTEDALIPEQRDDAGAFWEMKLSGETAETNLSLLASEESSFTITGEYRNSCAPSQLNRGRGPSYRTNKEGILSFEVESFVEKID